MMCRSRASASLSVLFAAFLILSPFTSGCVHTTTSTGVVSMIGYYTNTTCCGLLCWFTCHLNQSRILYATQLIFSHKCCPGYGPSYPDCDPICNNTCGENMVCSAPDTCTCASGWTGDDCLTDINECQEGTDKCEDNCINIPGLYLCACSNENDRIDPSNEYRCLSPVTNVQSIPVNRTLELSWTLPEGYAEDGNLTNITTVCTVTGSDTPGLTYTTDGIKTFIVAHSLIPFTNYTCCITPKWFPNDDGPFTCIDSTTLQDAPEDSPYNIIIHAISFNTLLIQWNPPTIPNGIIIHYTLYINYTNGSSLINKFVNAPFTSTYLEELFPYQLVGVSISATTGGGEGPRTKYIYHRTEQSEPYEVTDLDVIVLLNTTVKVSWSPPLLPNGIITSYNVKVFSKTVDRRFMKEETVSPLINPLLTHFTGLEPYVPYSAQVSAVTSAGEGPLSEFIFFTLETVPSISPDITSATRMTPTDIQITWSEITLEQSRGFIIQYNLYIIRSIDECRVVVKDETEEHNVSDHMTSYLFTELEPAANYCISIVAYTDIGRGVESQLQLVQTYENSQVRLHLTGTHECTQWRETNTQSKLNELDGIIYHLLLLECSSCDITQHYIFNSYFELCIPDNIIVYRTFILGTVTFNSSELVNIIRDWGKNKPTIVIQGVQLKIEAVCANFDPDSPSTLTCDEEESTESPTSHLNAAVVFVIAGFGLTILTLAVCIVVVVGAIVVMKKFSKGRRHNGRNYRPQDTEIRDSDIELQFMEKHSHLGKETSI